MRFSLLQTTPRAVSPINFCARLSFFVTGALMIATSPEHGPPSEDRSLSETVMLPEVILDNAQLEKTFTYRIRLIGPVEKRHSASLSMSTHLFTTVLHSDETPQDTPDNTPWVRARLKTFYPGENVVESVPFLESGGVSLPITFYGDCEHPDNEVDPCMADVSVTLLRVATSSSDLASTVRASIVFEANFVRNDSDETEPPPWTVQLVGEP